MSARDLQTDVLLIGGGVASARCARTLRRLGSDAPILLVGDEAYPPYNRPPLTKELLRDELPDDLVLAEPHLWYERRGVELLADAPVSALDPNARCAALTDGRQISFERCLLATGAAPRRLPVPGGEHARLVRTLADARSLRSAAIEAGRGAPAVVIGGGLIGVEVASALASLGLRVTIVERAERLWGGSLGARLGSWAAARLADLGVELVTGVAVTAVEPAAVVAGGDRLDAAVVVAGIGVEPRVELAAEARLAVDDGILTDLDQRTSHARVWAAGDVARGTSRRVEHWHAAREAGERAAHSMLGLPSPPVRAPWTFSEVAGTSFDVMGETTPVDEEREVAEGVLAFVRAGRLTGLAIVDAAMPAERARELVEAGASPGDVEAELAPAGG